LFVGITSRLTHSIDSILIKLLVDHPCTRVQPESCGARKGDLSAFENLRDISHLEGCEDKKRREF
jgi:hypothetical protein